MRQFREKWVAGAFVQQIGTNAPSSFTGLNVSSQAALRDSTILNVESVARLNVASQSALRDLTVANVASFNGVAVASNFVGNSAIRGLAVLAANVSVGSVVATGVVSGDVILTGVYMSGVNAGSSYTTRVDSVRADGFDVRINGTAGVALTIAWWKVS